MAISDAKAIAIEAIRLRPGDRALFLDRVCAGDPRLRAEVDAILDAEDDNTILGTPPNTARRPGEEPVGRAPAHPPTRIGSYEILSELGRGAMGVVYRARQRSPRRIVALKVIRPDAMDPDAIDRFTREAQLLARMRHPCIAAIYEAGTALVVESSPCPFFAMELVEGERIDTHARTRTLRERITLIIDLCTAMEHAHQRGVLHLDLKPSNILVDERGQVRVLDFGVARSLDARAVCERIGTPRYMAPEQLLACPDLDTRTDVFAIGVILYEILAGAAPFAADAPPSDLASTLDAIRAGPARRPRELCPSICRDLECVILRAIAGEPDDRYPSCRALADDLARALSCEPVSARAHTRPYLASRFIRRNRIPVGAAAIVAILLMLAVGAVSQQAIRATRGWHRARLEVQRASAVQSFLTSMLASVDPENALGREPTLREILDEAARTASLELRDQPHVEAAVRRTLGSTYRGLGLLEASEEQARRAADLSTRVMGPRDPSTIDARRNLVATLIERGSLDEAETLALGVLRDCRAVSAKGSADEALALGDLARICHESGRPQRALDLWQEALTIARQTRGEDDPETLVLMHNYASALGAMGRFGESEAMLREVIRMRETRLGADHPQTLTARSMLASIIQKAGRDGEAAEIFREVLAGRTRMLGEQHPSTLTAMGNLAVTLIRLGELEEAERLTRKALRGYREHLGDEHAKTIITMGNLAYLLEDQGKDDEAERLYREVLELRERAGGGRDPETWAAINNLAMLLMRTGKLDEARTHFERLLALCEEQLPQDHVYTALFRNNYAECLMHLGMLRDADEALRASHAILVRTFGKRHPRVKKSLERRRRLERRIEDRNRVSTRDAR